MLRETELRAAHAAVKREDWPVAWALSNHVLNDAPESPEALYLAGVTLRAMGHIGLAHVALSKALAREKKQPNLWMNYAACLHDLNLWAEAEQAFRIVNGMLPEDPMPLANIGATYVQRGMWRDSIEWCDKALAIEPTNHIAQISKTFACLSLGRWREGWKYAEALYGNHLQIRIYNDPEHEEPLWDGSPGQTVVVQCDQGVGDIIMFSQVLPRMIERCKKVIIDCAPRMVGLFQQNFPGCDVYGTLKDDTIDWPKRYQIDARIHISYLGRIFLNETSDFERKAYIRADPLAKSEWLRWLGQFPKPWVGIAWRGGIQQTQTHLRSVTIDDYAPLFRTGGTFIDLSYHNSQAEVARWNLEHETQIVRPRINAEDYAHTVALVDALDEIVTVTTTIAHVCGALGRRARVLVPAVAQWRYAHHMDDGGMIWYPLGSVELYRQAKGEDGWTAAIKRMIKDIDTSRKLRLCA